METSQDSFQIGGDEVYATFYSGNLSNITCQEIIRIERLVSDVSEMRCWAYSCRYGNALSSSLIDRKHDDDDDSNTIYFKRSTTQLRSQCWIA